MNLRTPAGNAYIYQYYNNFHISLSLVTCYLTNWPIYYWDQNPNSPFLTRTWHNGWHSIDVYKQSLISYMGNKILLLFFKFHSSDFRVTCLETTFNYLNLCPFLHPDLRINKFAQCWSTFKKLQVKNFLLICLWCVWHLYGYSSGLPSAKPHEHQNPIPCEVTLCLFVTVPDYWRHLTSTTNVWSCMIPYQMGPYNAQK